MAVFQPPSRNQTEIAHSCSNPQGAEGDSEEQQAEQNIKVQDPPRRPPAIPLRGVVQHYAWGKPSTTSIVAHMATEQVRKNQGPLKAPPLSRGQRFAELWMGTHSNGHSSVLVPRHRGDREPPMHRIPSSNVTPQTAAKLMQIQEDECVSSDDEGAQELFLRDVIEEDPVYWLGERDAHHKNIPFLFKVLSVRQALSVQAHPNKKLAEELHRTSPGHYPDDNHKPEICIPLGHFEALCGFRSIETVRKHVHEVPELRDLIGIEEDDINEASLKELYSKLMKADTVKQANSVVALVNRLKSSLDPSLDEKLILRLSQDYPTDVGIFSVYFLNYVVITEDMPHRFIYCAPDEPHAYLCGDAVECMAMSDNVIRAGLTQKFKDVDTLLRCMTWRDDLLDELVNVGDRIKENVIKYDPPVNDFMVYEVSGPVPEGIFFEKAAIAACASGSFRIDFQSNATLQVPEDDCAEHVIVDGAELVVSSTPWQRQDSAERRPGGSSRGAKRIGKGNTFFSKAGSKLIVLSAEEGSKLFIATYKEMPLPE